MNTVLYLLLGLVAGCLSGLLGIGGGTIIIPALVLLFQMPQATAQGTTLAMMVPPIGLLAAWTYYQKDAADLKIAALMCITFVIGSFITSRYAVTLSDTVLTRIFGVFLLFVSLKMIFLK